MSKQLTNEQMMAQMMKMMQDMMSIAGTPAEDKSKASAKKSASNKETKYYDGDHFTVFKTKTGSEVEKHAERYRSEDQKHDRNCELKGMIKMFGGEWCGDIDDGVYRWRLPNKAETDAFVERAKKYDEMCVLRQQAQ